MAFKRKKTNNPGLIRVKVKVYVLITRLLLIIDQVVNPRANQYENRWNKFKKSLKIILRMSLKSLREDYFKNNSPRSLIWTQV